MDDNNFFSIDKLINFGMGMAMAQQMVNMMNQSMKQMYVPGSIQSMPKATVSPTYYVALEGKALGPLNEGEIAKLIEQKKVNKDTLTWMPGMSEWKPIEQVPAVLKIIALTPPKLPTT